MKCPVLTSDQDLSNNMGIFPNIIKDFKSLLEPKSESSSLGGKIREWQGGGLLNGWSDSAITVLYLNFVHPNFNSATSFEMVNWLALSSCVAGSTFYNEAVHFYWWAKQKAK